MFGPSRRARRAAALWCRTNLRGESGTPFSPDAQQARVIATVDRHALVAARAGSGKTATMVARAAYLTQQCGVAADAILMLAFNRVAADEMRMRFKQLMPDAQAPQIMTFHALAHRLVHPAENLLFDQSDTMRALRACLPTVSTGARQNLGGESVPGLDG